MEGWTEEDLIGRLSVFRDEYSTKLVLGELEMFRKNGHAQGITEIAGRVRARLFDLSVFMKELKLKMTLAYNYGHGRKGTQQRYAAGCGILPMAPFSGARSLWTSFSRDSGKGSGAAGKTVDERCAGRLGGNCGCYGI